MSRQGELFLASKRPATAPPVATQAPSLSQQQLLTWQNRIRNHQLPLFAQQVPDGAKQDGQRQLIFAELGPIGLDPHSQASALNPLSLHAHPLSFWRWPSAPHQGAAIYVVMDRPSSVGTSLLLYVGETGRADQRWKGAHDCKGYLAAYSEALATAGLESNLSIRFWCDVPSSMKPRRALELALIQRWLPPFNKETRNHWTTPFTADTL